MPPHRSITVAAHLHPQHGSYDDLSGAAARAELIGFDAVYNWDHFYPLYGDEDGAHFEAMTVLAAWAAVTSKVRVGTLVTCAAYRNADLLADMIRTIDHIAGGGRTVLGLGSGWFDRDFAEYGYEFGSAASRIDHLEVSLHRIKRRLSALNPTPIERIPILIGGTGERRTLRLVAEHADEWHAGFPDHADEVVSAVEALERHCADVGRSPDQIERGVGVEPYDLDRFLADEAPQLVEMGFTMFSLGFNGPDWNLDSAAAWLAWRDNHNSA